MIGQDRIGNQLRQALPDSTLLIGPSGCGKHTMADELSKYYNVPLIDITDNISDEYIAQMQLRALPTLYLIDLNKLSTKEQNVALKCIEEPSETFKVILIVNNKESVLNTIINRCVQYIFDEYSKEDLLKFVPSDCTDVDMILDVVKTPGQLKGLTNLKFKEMIDLCSKMVSKLSVASYSNTLTIASRINYKDEYDKFDLDIFSNVLRLLFYREYLKEFKEVYYNLYLKTSEFINKMRDSRLNKKLLFENYLTNIWMEVRGC
jgi:replication-associated recombination protein RarA